MHTFIQFSASTSLFVILLGAISSPAAAGFFDNLADEVKETVQNEVNEGLQKTEEIAQDPGGELEASRGAERARRSQEPVADKPRATTDSQAARTPAGDTYEFVDFQRQLWPWVELSIIRISPDVLEDEAALELLVRRLYPEEYRSIYSNEFNKKRELPKLKEQLIQRASAQPSRARFFAGPAPIVGQYDFQRKGFEFNLRSCLNNLGSSKTLHDLNVNDHVFIPMDESTAESIVTSGKRALLCELEVVPIGTSNLFESTTNTNGVHRSIIHLASNNLQRLALDVQAIRLYDEYRQAEYRNPDSAIIKGDMLAEVDIEGIKKGTLSKMLRNKAFLRELVEDGCYLHSPTERECSQIASSPRIP